MNTVVDEQYGTPGEYEQEEDLGHVVKNDKYSGYRV